MISATEILQAQLAHSLGLGYYSVLLHVNPDSQDYRRVYNRYYRVRRNDEWRKQYYDVFSIACHEHYSFEQIVTELYKRTGYVEASFSSKMLATIDPSKPIWDQYVLHNLGLVLNGRTQAEKVHNAVNIYKQIERWYADYLVTSEAKKNIQGFCMMLPDYAWISDVKKIDCLLWSKR